MVNDITREEIMYISLRRSNVLWVQVLKSRVKPFSRNIHSHLEELYKSHLVAMELNPNDESLLHKKYQSSEYKV